jgi:tetratricopeptide (TPR) repeat protein
MFSAVSLVIAQAVAPTPGAPVSREPTCTEDGGVYRANVWERAKFPDLRLYCDLLASAASKLAGPTPMVTAALDAARAADAALPGQGGALVLEGRALAILGRAQEAMAAFDEARARDPRAFEVPVALLALARTFASLGRDADASRAYRVLLPRSGGLPAADRSAIAAEAGIEAMQVGPESIDEAAADLREALRGAQGDAERFVVLALALALDRAGKVSEARTLLADRARGEPRSVVSAWSSVAAVPVRQGEGAAMAALALEGSDAAGARDGWTQSLEVAPHGPWANHARDHLTSLRAGLPAGERRR